MTLSFPLNLSAESQACLETQDSVRSLGSPPHQAGAPGAPLHAFLLSITAPLSSFLCYPVFCSIFLLPALFLPSPCNKSQPVYNPLGAVHNYSGSNCRSIYITQCRGLASLMEVCVSSERVFHKPTAWAQVLLGLIDVRLSLAGPAWVCSIKWSFAKSGQRRGAPKQHVAHARMRGKKKLQFTCWLDFNLPTVRLTVGNGKVKTWQRDVPRLAYKRFCFVKKTAGSDLSWPPRCHKMVWCMKVEAWYVQQHIYLHEDSHECWLLLFNPHCWMRASRYQYS